MMKRFASSIIVLLVLVFPLLTSCLTDNTSDYTAEKEKELLDEYIGELIRNGYNVDTTALGVFYVRLQSGTGAYPVEGDTISVKYIGYLIDGSVFNHSFYNSIDSCWTYVHKVEQTISSWEEMMGLMNRNCKMEFIIPSSLAYGSAGSGTIPPYSSLIFVAIMKDVRTK